MGIKLLALQKIPWCFPMTGGGGGGGSTSPCHHPDPPAATSTPTVKLIGPDGRVEVYHRAVSASEVMSDHPKHLVCRSDAFTIGQRVPALAEWEELQPGHAYFLLPLHFFQSVLSFVTLASSFARAASASPDGRPPALLLRPFDVHRTPSGALQIRLSDDFVERVKGTQEGGGGDGWGGGGGGRVCTTAALEKDYRQLVVGSRARQWRPKLETITESERQGRGRSDIKPRKKKQQQRQPEEQQQEQLQQQKKKPQHKVSSISQLLNSTPPLHKAKGKKGVACNL